MVPRVLLPDGLEPRGQGRKHVWGPIVDHGTTSLVDFDFYLQVHAGLQGSIHLTHYIVRYEESSLTTYAMQQGVHATSHLYVRTTSCAPRDSRSSCSN
jgi:hypothetical protein